MATFEVMKKSLETYLAQFGLVLFSVLLPKIIHVLGSKLTIFTLIMILASQVYFNA